MFYIFFYRRIYFMAPLKALLRGVTATLSTVVHRRGETRSIFFPPAKTVHRRKVIDDLHRGLSFSAINFFHFCSQTQRPGVRSQFWDL